MRKRDHEMIIAWQSRTLRHRLGSFYKESRAIGVCSGDTVPISLCHFVVIMTGVMIVVTLPLTMPCECTRYMHVCSSATPAPDIHFIPVAWSNGLDTRPLYYTPYKL